jgi:DNA modification methylase
MTWQILTGDCLDVLPTLPAQSVHTCVTSPPYFWLRDYGTPGQFGLESTPDEYVTALVAVFREVRRVLRDDGTVWLNLGDSYNSAASNQQHGVASSNLQSVAPDSGLGRRSLIASLKPKDLLGIPWMVAFALRADGWYLRSDIIWSKPNPMPESVTDRPTKAHEYVFLLSKSARYYYDADAISEASVSDHPSGNGYARPERQSYQNADGTARGQVNGWTDVGGLRNKRSVWTVATQPYAGAHFATFPLKLIEPCILAGCPVGGTVLDPFAGAGTTIMQALRLNRSAIGVELSPEYAALVRNRVLDDCPLHNSFAEHIV